MFFFYLLFAKLQVCIVIHCKVVKRSCECTGSYLHLETLMPLFGMPLFSPLEKLLLYNPCIFFGI